MQEMQEQLLGAAEDEMDIPEEELTGEEIIDFRTFLEKEG